MDSSPIDVPISSSLPRLAKGTTRRSFKTESQPDGAIGNTSAIYNLHSPFITPRHLSSNSAPMYIPWANHRQSVSIHPIQAMNSSYSPHEDPNSNYYSEGANSWAFPQMPTNTTVNSMPSSFSSTSDLNGANLGLITNHPVYNGLPTINTRHDRSAMTPEESSQSILLTPTSDKAWPSYKTDCDDESTGSPALGIGQSTASILRSDGMRKKNARFEIPEERNLHTIDNLISTAKCESLVKELKTQKRLLKNREAALQSRQRKKQHTETLEGEKKHFLSQIANLQNSLAMVGAERERLERQLDWQTMEAEKKLQHLQTENSKLKHQVLLSQQPALSTPSSTILTPTAYDDFPDELNPIAFNTTEWIGLIGNSCFDSTGGVAPGRRDMSTAMKISDQYRPSDLSALTSKATASRFIVILVMAGTMIKASQMPERAMMSLLSKLQDEVKAVSAKVLDCVLRSGNVNILDHVSCVEFRSGDFDQGILDIMSTMQNHLTPDAIDDLNNIVDYATSKVRSQSLSSMEQSPHVGSLHKLRH